MSTRIPLLRYPGGKHQMFKKIAPFIPAHLVCTEAYGGSAAFLLNKERSQLEVYNDLSDNAWNFMTMFRDHTDELVYLIKYTPWGTTEHALCQQWHEDPLERARRFYFRCWSSIRPFDSASGFRRQKKLSGGMTTAVKAFTRTDHLYDLADRLRGVVMENMEATDFLKLYDSEQALHLVDPPFPADVRKNGRQDLYDVEMKDEQSHRDLAECLHGLSGMVILCGYKCDLYQELYEANGWERHDLKVRVNGGREAIESLWLNLATIKARQCVPQLGLF